MTIKINIRINQKGLELTYRKFHEDGKPMPFLFGLRTATGYRLTMRKDRCIEAIEELELQASLQETLDEDIAHQAFLEAQYEKPT